MSSSAPSLVYDRGDCAAVSKAGVAVKSSAYKHLSESRESICKSISRVYFGASDLYDRGYSQYLVVVQASRQSNAPRNRYSAHQTYKLMHKSISRKRPVSNNDNKGLFPATLTPLVWRTRNSLLASLYSNNFMNNGFSFACVLSNGS